MIYLRILWYIFNFFFCIHTYDVFYCYDNYYLWLLYISIIYYLLFIESQSSKKCVWTRVKTVRDWFICFTKCYYYVLHSHFTIIFVYTHTYTYSNVGSVLCFHNQVTLCIYIHFLTKICLIGLHHIYVPLYWSYKLSGYNEEDTVTTTHVQRFLYEVVSYQCKLYVRTCIFVVVTSLYKNTCFY